MSRLWHITFGREVGDVVVVRKNLSRRNTHGAHTGERGNFIPRTVGERNRLRRRAAVKIGRHRKLQHAAGVHSQIRVFEIHKGPCEKPRACQQHRRERHLRDDQQLAETNVGAARGNARTLIF